jgi:hypothetical protein
MKMQSKKTEFLLFRALLLFIIFIFFLIAAKGFAPDWNVSFNPVSSYWGGSPDENKYILKSFSVFVLLLFACYAVATSLIGCCILLSLFPGVRSLRDNYGLAPFVLGSYSFGVLGVAAINRTVTLFTSNLVALAIIAAVVAAFSIYSISDIRKVRDLPKHNPGSRISGKYAIATFLTFCIFLIFQLHATDVHIIGDGAKFTLGLIENKQVLGLDGRIPLIDQHYDELLYLFPLFLQIDVLSNNTSNVLQVFWLHYSLAKASSFLLMIGVGVLIGLPIRRSALIALLCFFGSVYISPLRHILIFDSGGPIAFSLHPARVFVSVIFVAVLAFSYKGYLNVKVNLPQILFILLFSVGLGALTVSGASIFVAIAIGLFSRPINTSTPANSVLILVLICGFLLAAFSLRSANNWGAWVLPATIFIAALVVLRSLSTGARSGDLNIFRSCDFVQWKTVVLILSGYFASLMLLGNIFVKDYSWVSVIGQSIVHRGVAATSFGIGINPFCGIFPHGYCGSPINFINSFGLPLLLITIVGLFLNRSEVLRGVQPILRLTLVAMFLYIGSLWLFIFVNSGANGDPDFWLIWYKSRLVEPFFYSSIFFSLGSIFLLNPEKSRISAGSAGFVSRLNYVTIGVLMYLTFAAIVDNTPKIIWANLMYIVSLDVRYF